MKTQKLHILPLGTPFFQKIKTGVPYYNQTHYTNFDDNSFEIIPFKQPPEGEHRPTDSLFKKVLDTLCLSNIKHLKKLNLSIERSCLFKKSTLRRFSLILAQNFKTLKQLDLHFLSCKGLDGENFRYLLDGVAKRMGSLIEVNLCFLACTDVDDQCLRELKLLILKRCKDLQRLKVIISASVLNEEDKGFTYFEPDLNQRLRNNTLSFYFERHCKNQITSKGLFSLCRNIARYLKKLRSLTFQMESFQQENDQKLVKSICKMIAGLPNLEDLSFCIDEEINIDDKYLEELFSCIGQKLKKLTSLSLDFDGRDITDQLTHDFFSSLPSQLRYFALNLYECNSVTDDYIREIGLNIVKNLMNLQTMILIFSHMEHLTSSSLSELTQIISKGLPSLKKLVLDFDYCEGIDQSLPLVLPEQIEQFDLYLYKLQFLVHNTWKGLNRLSLSFDICFEKESFLDLFSEPSLTLKNLNELKLLYSQSKELSDKEVESLASAIGTNLRNLMSLELGFSLCELLTSDSLMFLGDKICRKLKGLRHLTFIFFRTDSLYEGGLIYLISSMSKLKRLESLTLFFAGSIEKEENFEQVFNLLCSAIYENLKGLKKLTLSLDLYNTLELKREIRKKLSHIPMLHIY